MSNQDNLSRNELTHSILIPGHSGKVTAIKTEETYNELDDFREKLEEKGKTYFTQPFTQHKNNALSYRLIFASIGILFIFLIALLAFKTSFWYSNLYDTQYFLAKSVLIGTCSFLSFCSLCFAYNIRAEKEAIHYILQKAKKRLRQLYSRRKSGLGLKRFYDYEQAHPLKNAYHQAFDQMYELKVHAMHLIKEVSSSKEIDSVEKERLFNQAILEFRDKLNKVIQHY
jgi:hypothetical protein